MNPVSKETPRTKRTAPPPNTNRLPFNNISFFDHPPANQCNVRKEADIKAAVQQCIADFGQLDCVVYNAGAILWERVQDTSLKRFDLMNDVNVRGAYCTVQEALPGMLERKSGRILLNSPPIYSR